MVAIRTIQASDNAKMKTIIQSSLMANDLAIKGTAYFDPQLDYLSKYYDAEKYRHYFVAVDDSGELLGGAGVGEYDLDKKIAEFQKLYLSPNARGKGLSYQLLDKTVEFAQKEGYEQLYLETHHNLAPAIHIYEKYGFKALERPIKAGEHSAMDKFYILDL
ncbi:GNAT family N-acetyltransferase [Eupransor demetentiae]|uniref:L-amino acid N-acyltransferase MnaT (MnaT) n=1 Tax=Eupransor demetentiae TaxID=3109584 RepID=A0ABP0ENX3_9LACO|nr:L-amino acid N-acyltransferase MnaT (MnaT) [Lactobacillaceae bacterium LMG 33000]